MFNNSSNLYGSEWLAVVFNNRNKSYGAYLLRAQSSTILVKSLFGVSVLFVALFAIPIIYAHYKPVEEVLVSRVIQIAAPQVIHELKKEEPELEPVKAAPAKAKVKTVNFTTNVKVVADNKVTLPPVTIDELKDAVIGSFTQDGITSQGNTLPNASATTGGGDGSSVVGMADETVHNVSGVEVYPEFPGGMTAWAKFIQRNLKYPYMAQDANVQGKVYLSFVVERDGSITDVSVIRGIGSGCDEEAIRVIKKSPKWKAGRQNNENVRVRYTMPINYTLSL